MSLEHDEPAAPLPIGGRWNVEMASVKEMLGAMKRHMGSDKADFIAGFEFALRLCEEKFWKVKDFDER